jgi:hypothetical protein
MSFQRETDSTPYATTVAVGVVGPVSFNVADVEPAIVDRARDEIRVALQEFQTPAGIRLRGAVWVVTAIRP